MGVRAATSFLTPLGGARVPGLSDLAWFPVVGLGIGAALGALWWGIGKEWPPTVDAAVVVAADLALTGLLHIDGLIDSADGLLPHLDRARRLAVMAEPQVGAFGVAAGGMVLVLRVAALGAIHPDVLVLGGLWCLSRTLMAAVVSTQPYARAGGLAEAFSGRAPRSRGLALVVGAAGAVALLMVWRPLAGAMGALAGIVAAVGVLVLARRRLGGYTGDVLGASGMMLETVGLVVAAARW
jgi:adenosylcobinamide-GDP ribazoletransferase